METKDQAAPSTRPKAAASSPVTNLKRYKEIARLLWKYGRSDLVSQMDLDEPLDSRRRRLRMQQGRSNWPTISKRWGRRTSRSAKCSPVAAICFRMRT
jgi:hypothetical protein